MTAQSDILHSLTIDRRLAAPPPVVFRHWADAQLRQRWWGPAGFTCSELASDFRPRGIWSATITSPRHGTYRMAGLYREIVADRLIRFSFRWTTDANPHETEVAVTFKPVADGGTLLRFTQGPFPQEADRDGHIGGWEECLDRLCPEVGITR